MRTLIIEDDLDMASAIQEGLQKEGFTVDTVNEGGDACTRIMLYRDTYDIIILDLMLPGMSGKEICQAVRAEGITIPILVLSAHNKTEEKVDLLHSGADDYMEKPFSVAELTARMRALLRRPKEVMPTVLTLLDIELNSNKRTVKRGDQTLELTLKEYALLEYFMRNPERVLSREDIMENLWDFNDISFSNVLDVHIKNLRKKLGEDGSQILETVRGVGYRINA